MSEVRGHGERERERDEREIEEVFTKSCPMPKDTVAKILQEQWAVSADTDEVDAADTDEVDGGSLAQ